jgi:hypothetical protein
MTTPTAGLLQHVRKVIVPRILMSLCLVCAFTTAALDFLSCPLVSGRHNNYYEWQRSKTDFDLLG